MYINGGILIIESYFIHKGYIRLYEWRIGSDCKANILLCEEFVNIQQTWIRFCNTMC